MSRRFPSFLQPEVVPFVEVVIVPAFPDAPLTPVVDVELEPLDEEDQDVDEGSRCGVGCGFCGRCA